MTFLPTIKKWFAATLIVIVVTTTIAPIHTRAQFATIDVANVVQNTLTAISTAATTISDYYNEYKESVLDGLAWSLAKAVLQSMTSDIVDWINGGFEGNPAFVSNPEGFFLDAADQATGMFLGNGGPLDALCSPFSLDIRLSLSLTLAQRQRQRYACTLSTVINNARNARVNVSGTATVNGRTVQSINASASANGSHSVEGFMGGDFQQGGWSAFTALATQPQNNVYGAYIQADSELHSNIAQTQANIHADLSMGSGFMSWEKCKTIYSYDQDNPADSGYGQQLVETTPDTRIKSGKDGMVNIESCHKETPGSVIGSSLNKQLGIPADSLNMADEINEIVSALFSQLVVQVLNGGLLASSAGGAGNQGNLSNRIRNQAQRDLEKHRSKLIEDAEKAASTTAQTLPIFTEAFNIVDTERSAYLALIDCMNQSGATSSQAYRVLTRVLNEEIEPMYREFKETYENALSNLVALERIAQEARTAENLSQLMDANSEYGELITGSSLVTRTAIARAKEDLRKVRNEVEFRSSDQKPNWRSELKTYRNSCTPPAETTTTP